SGLAEVDAALRVRDVVLPEGVSLAAHVDPDEVVVKIAALRAVVVEEAAPAAVEAEAPAAETEEPEQG
ncbi:MAG TPA: hypothetical protein DCX12_01785, partial [Chloroflexi bacterium]|nr:hypothetical protein [Chloroflexota bacterium]HBV93512.1 hypothetical protein [Chloroflexota bacterium]